MQLSSLRAWLQANRVQLQAGRVQLQANRVQLQAGRAQPQANRVQPQASRAQPQANRVQLQAGRAQPQAGDGLIALVALVLLAEVVGLTWRVSTVARAVIDSPPLRLALPLAMGERRSVLGNFDPFFPNHTDSGAQLLTVLDLQLFGVIINQATRDSAAILADDSGEQHSYHIGEEISAGVHLVEVAFDHIVIDHHGTRESLFLDQSVTQSVTQSKAIPFTPDSDGRDSTGGLSHVTRNAI